MSSIIQRLKEAHAAAQEAKGLAYGAVSDAVVKKAICGDLIDESGLSPAELHAIDPEIERERLSYHSAKRYVAENKDQLCFSAFKLLMEHNVNQGKESGSPKSPSVEAARLVGNFLKQMGKVETEKLTDEERWALKLWVQKVKEEVSELEGKL